MTKTRRLARSILAVLPLLALLAAPPVSVSADQHDDDMVAAGRSFTTRTASIAMASTARATGPWPTF